MFIILLLSQLIIITIDVCAADPLVELPPIEMLPSEPPSLFTQCLHALKKLSPEKFQDWQYTSLEIKKKFIIEHGLTYVPKLFVLSQAIDSFPQIDGTLQDNKPLRLCNNLMDIMISKQEPAASEAPQEARNQLPKYRLSCPECTCASLQGNTIYVCAQNNEIWEYQAKHHKLKLLSKQPLSQEPITYIIAHPCIEHLIACRHQRGSIGIYKKNKQGPWVNQKEINLHRSIEKMAFCPSGKWLACANSHNVYIHDLTSVSGDVKHKLTHAANKVDALLFKDNQTLIMNSASGTLNNQQLTVWRFRTDTNASNYTIWGTSKIILAHNEYYGLDKEFENNDKDENDDEDTNTKWVTHISNQILYKLVLDNIQSLQELDIFKKYKDNLDCGEQPLFKLIAIMDKNHALQKAKADRERSAYVRK